MDTVVISIDLQKTKQTIEGFGFYGMMDGVRDDYTSAMYSEKWGEKIIGDLGITIWRNVIAPNYPSPEGDRWERTKPTVIALNNKAKEHGVDLKIILSVWSPPGEWKANGKTDGKDPSHPLYPSWESSHGDYAENYLLKEHYADYADWLVKALDMYKNIGINVYGLSLQNEPAFNEFYDSCKYDSRSYIEMMKTVVPLIRTKYPDIKIFGAESMLSFESDLWALDLGWWFHRSIANDPEALDLLDSFAVHGYSDGILAQAVTSHRRYWMAHNNQISETGKTVWMSETSGYTEKWIADGQKPGALDLGLAIASALKYGNVSAWVFWTGSTRGSYAADEYSLMDGTRTGKRYAVSKHFYKFIRPGAVMLETDTRDDNVLAVAFKHQEEKRFTMVIVNTSANDKEIILEGNDLPNNWTLYRTTRQRRENCTETALDGRILVPAYSIITLINENWEYSK